MTPALLVFAIEDDLDDTKFLQEAFNRVGIVDYEFFPNSGEFFAVFNEHVPVVVVDLNLPGMHGLDVLRKIKKINERCKVIAASGVITNEMTVQLSLSKADGIVVKEKGWETRLAKMVLNFLEEAYEEFEARANSLTEYKEIKGLLKRNGH